MGDEPKSFTESPLVSELRAVGISEEMLKRAAATANSLRAGSGSLAGGTLDPRSSLEYRQLFISLARKPSQ